MYSNDKFCSFALEWGGRLVEGVLFSNSLFIFSVQIHHDISYAMLWSGIYTMDYLTNHLNFLCVHTYKENTGDMHIETMA